MNKGGNYLKIHRKGLVIAAAVLFFCGLCAVRFTFAGKYIMIPYWTKSTSPKGMYNSVKAVAETMSLLDGKLKEIVKEAAEKKLEIGL